MNQLYIFNGSKMLSYFQTKYPDSREIYTSFNEAMCWGNVCENIFSEEFIKTRSLSLNTTVDEYKKTVIDSIYPLLSKDDSEITLWFDSDMFCQINLLTLLAYLDQVKYHKSVKFNLVDYQHEIQKTFTLTAEGYKNIYKAVLINKSVPEHLDLPVMKASIELYLNLQKKDNEISYFIREHADLPTMELLKLLLKNFQHYGLGDIQYLQLINTEI